MTRAPLAMGALLFAAGAFAQEPSPERKGYAFGHPRLMAQQRVFGLAHGITLLAAACRGEGEAAADEAYAAWRARQGQAIAAAVRDLSDWYFGRGIADWHSIARKIGLRETLSQAPGSAALKAACATFPEAVRRPRYDLAARFRLEEQMARVAAAADVEARHRHCRRQLDGHEREAHEAQHRLWREINDPVARKAADILEREWPEDAPAGSYPEWLAMLEKQAYAGGGRAACLDFSASLKRPESFLRNAFSMPPPADPK